MCVCKLIVKVLINLCREKNDTEQAMFTLVNKELITQ